MAFLAIKDLRASHTAIRKQTNIVSRHVFKLRKKVDGIRSEVETLYENVKMPVSQRKLAIASEVKTRVNALARPLKDEFTASLRALEAERLKIEAGRETMTNKITRLNALTILDQALSAKRANTSIILANAGPAELQLAAEAAKSVGDLGTLAACVTRNSSLKTSDRRFSNAEILKDVELPDQAEINAIYGKLYQYLSMPCTVCAAWTTLAQKIRTRRSSAGLLTDKLSSPKMEVSRRSNLNPPGHLPSIRHRHPSRKTSCQKILTALANISQTAATQRSWQNAATISGKT